MSSVQEGQRPGVGVGVLVERDGEILLLRRRKHGAGHWCSPGGYLDHGEAPEVTAVRETVEETGVRLSGASFLGVTNDLHPDGRHNVTLWFAGHDPEGEPVIAAPAELDAVGWFPRDALPTPLYLPLRTFLAGQVYRPAR